MKPSKKAIRAVAVMLAKEDARQQCYDADSEGFGWNFPADINHFFDEELVVSNLGWAADLLKTAYDIDRSA